MRRMRCPGRLARLGRRVRSSLSLAVDTVRDAPLRTILIVWLFILAFVPSITIAIVTFNRTRVIFENVLSQYSLTIMDGLSWTIDYRIGELDGFSVSLLGNLDVQTALRQANEGFASPLGRMDLFRRVSKILFNASVIRGDIDSVSLFSLDGVELASYQKHPSMPSTPSRIADAMRRQLVAMKGAGVWLTTQGDRGIVPLARAVLDLETMRVLGYLVANVREDSLYELYADLDKRIVGELQGTLFIMNSSGEIVSGSSKDSLGRKAKPDSLIALCSVGGRGILTQKIDKEDSYIYYYRLEKPGWQIVGIIPAFAYRKDIVAIRNSFLLLACCVLGFSVLVSFSVSHRVSRPILSLANAMKQVEKGRFAFENSYKRHNEVGILYERFQSMVREIDALVRKVYVEEVALRDAKLKALMMQINPHFLYNTLESMNWIARLKGVPEIGDMAKALGDLLRSNISDEDTITIAEEVRNVRSYLSLQKFRYGDKFDSFIDIDDSLLPLRIPRLILQPLVENAIVHGIERMKGKGIIRIEGMRVADRVTLFVTDNGIGVEQERIFQALRESPDRGSQGSIGLRNVHTRLSLQYGDDYGLRVSSRPNEGTRATIVLPFPLPRASDSLIDEHKV
jgi:two-component system sensor histidine kinase YesM